jgi:hypothetical protein
VYFDTPSHQLYRQHVQRRRHRYKVRTRSYLDSGECSFEAKLKSNRSETVKSRMPCSPADRGRLTGPAREFLGEQLRSAYGTTVAKDCGRRSSRRTGGARWSIRWSTRG